MKLTEVYAHFDKFRTTYNLIPNVLFLHKDNALQILEEQWLVDRWQNGGLTIQGMSVIETTDPKLSGRVAII